MIKTLCYQQKGVCVSNSSDTCMPEDNNNYY